HGQTSGSRRQLGGGQCRTPDAWWLRIRDRIRYRAQVPRDTPLSGRADLNQSDPVVCRGTCAGNAEVLLMDDAARPTGWSPHPDAPLPIPGPLSGITVVSIEQAVAAPFATRQLADQGA